MPNHRRKIKVLAATAIVSALSSQSAMAQDTQTVVITAPSNASFCCYSGGNFDNYLGNFFSGSPMRSSGFGYPESEAFAVVFGNWLKPNSIPKPAMSINACSPDPNVSGFPRTISSHDEPLLRLQAAKQIATSIFPNFINTKKDGLIIEIVFSDGGSEQFRHTTMAGWLPVADTLKLGTGVPGSNCAN